MRNILPRVIDDTYRAGDTNGSQVTACLDAAFPASILSEAIEAVSIRGGTIAELAADRLTAIFPESTPLACIEAGAEILAANPEGVRVGAASGRVDWGIVGSARRGYYLRGPGLDLARAACQATTPDAPFLLHASVHVQVSDRVQVLDGSRDLRPFGSLLERTPGGIRDALEFFYASEHRSLEREIALAFYPMAAFAPPSDHPSGVVVSFRVDIQGEGHEPVEKIATNLIEAAEVQGGFIPSFLFREDTLIGRALFGVPISHRDDPSRALRFAHEARMATHNLQLGVADGTIEAQMIGSNWRSVYAPCDNIVIRKADELAEQAAQGQVRAATSLLLELKRGFDYEGKDEALILGQPTADDAGAAGHGGFAESNGSWRLIQTWLEGDDSEAPLSIEGPANSGKTRLLLELQRRHPGRAVLLRVPFTRGDIASTIGQGFRMLAADVPVEDFLAKAESDCRASGALNIADDLKRFAPHLLYLCGETEAPAGEQPQLLISAVRTCLMALAVRSGASALLLIDDVDLLTDFGRAVLSRICDASHDEHDHPGIRVVLTARDNEGTRPLLKGREAINLDQGARIHQDLSDSSLADLLTVAARWRSHSISRSDLAEISRVAPMECETLIVKAIEQGFFVPHGTSAIDFCSRVSYETWAKNPLESEARVHRFISERKLAIYGDAGVFSEEISDHLQAAGDTSQLFQYQLAAARFHNSIGDRGSAVRLLEQAGRSDAEAALLSEAALELGEVYCKQEDYTRALPFLNRTETLHAPHRALFLHLRGRIYAAQGRYGQALQMLERAQDRAQTDGIPMWSARAFREIGNIHLKLGEYAPAETAYREAARLHAELEDRSGVGMDLYSMSLVARWDGRPDRARDNLEQAVSLLKETDRAEAVEASYDLGIQLRNRGRLADSRQHFEFVAERARALGKRTQEYAAIRNLAIISGLAGEYGHADQLVARAKKLANILGEPRARARAFFCEGRLAYDRREYARTIEAFEAAFIIIKEDKVLEEGGRLFAFLACTYARLKQPVRALKVAIQYFKLLKKTGRPVEHGRIYLAMALVLKEGRALPEKARAALDELTALTGLQESPSVYFDAALEEARSAENVMTLIPALREYAMFRIGQANEQNNEHLRKVAAMYLRDAWNRANRAGMVVEVNRLEEYAGGQSIALGAEQDLSEPG